MKKLLLIFSLTLLGSINFHLAGQNWQVFNSPIGDDLNAVFINAHGDVFIGSDIGKIYRLDANGTVNTTTTPVGIDGVTDITFLNSSEGWAVGDDGLILHSTDSGATWLSISSGVNANLEAIFFLDKYTAYITGRDGTILKSTDGGMNWTSQTSGTLNRLEDIWFVSPTHGFVAGRDGSFLATTDGGITWLQQSLGPDDNSSLHFLNDSVGFIAGENGIFKTSDGGTNWTAVNDSSLDDINVLYFADNSIGYAMGENGAIGKSIDAGNNWQIDTIITSLANTEINDLYFFNSSQGMAVGDMGTILIIGQMGIGNPGTGAANASFSLDYTQSGGTNLYLYNTSTPLLTDPDYTVSYVWDFGDGDTSHQAFPVHLYNSFGSYTICLTVTAIDSQNFVSTDTFCDTLGIDSSGNVLYKKGANGFTLNVLDPSAMGIEDRTLPVLRIYPNPASDFIHFEAAEYQEESELSIFSLDGRLLKSEVKKPGDKFFINELSPGTYILLLETKDKNIFRYKILKE